MLIRYVGAKSQKTDNVAGTGLTWLPGQSHQVRDLAACKKLLAHADIWALDETAEDPAAEAKKAAEVAADEAAKKKAADEAAEAKLIADAKAAAEKAEADRAAAEAAAKAAPTKTPIEKMDRHQLVRELEARKIKFHPRTGDDKLRALLIEA